MRCISPWGAVASTGRRRAGRSITPSMSRGISSASKSCPRARFWRLATGKKRVRQIKRASAPPSSRTITPLPDLDLRGPLVLAEIRREAAMMAQHPENDAIDAWIEAITDWDDLWPPYDWDDFD